MSKGTPVYFISLGEFSYESQSMSFEQILRNKIIKNKMWGVIKNWNNL